MLKIAHHPIYHHPLKEGHRFPMIKYDLLPEQLILKELAIQKTFLNQKSLTINIFFGLQFKILF
jgi:hypothetical protein